MFDSGSVGPVGCLQLGRNRRSDRVSDSKRRQGDTHMRQIFDLVVFALWITFGGPRIRILVTEDDVLNEVEGRQ